MKFFGPAARHRLFQGPLWSIVQTYSEIIGRAEMRRKCCAGTQLRTRRDGVHNDGLDDPNDPDSELLETRNQTSSGRGRSQSGLCSSRAFRGRAACF